MKLILDSTQFNLNFEPSFVGIYQVLREMWREFLNMNFKLEILANFEFLGISNLSTNRSYNHEISVLFPTKIEI